MQGCLTSKNEVRASEDLAADHRRPQALLHDGEAHGDDEQHEEAEGVAPSVKDSNDEQERGRACSLAVRVQVAVVDYDHINERTRGFARCDYLPQLAIISTMRNPTSPER
jgi:hypothetical protein